jgi:hypothetical protein
LHLSISFILKLKSQFMSRATKGFQMEDFKHVTDGLVVRIQSVLADRAVRRFSSSAIYKAHNELFKLKEPQQTCDSCLTLRADKLAKWYDWYGKEAASAAPEGVQIPVLNVGQGTEAEQAAILAAHNEETAASLANLMGPSTDAAIIPAAFGTETINMDTTAALAEGAADAATPEELAALASDAAALAHQAATPELPAVLEGAVRVIVQKINKETYAAEGDPIYADFTASADDASKGIVLNPATGKALAPGTYATEVATQVLAVSVGGNATYKTLQAQ